MIKLVLAASLATSPALVQAAPPVPPAKVAVPFSPTRFSVVVEGQGPDVILIPGLSSTRAVWARTAERLKRTHRVHLVQIKGFGEAAGPNASGPVLAPFVAELADYLRSAKLDRPAIAGHSMGGLAALKLGIDAPELPGRIMVVDALPFIGPLFGSADVAAIAPRAEQMKAMLLGRAAAALPDFAATVDCPANLPAPPTPAGVMTNSAEGACLMQAGARASDLRVVGQAMADDMTTDLRASIAGIRAPVTLVYPQDDRLVSAEEAAKLYATAYAANPRTRLVPVKGSFHFVMQDQPAAFAAALDEFLR